MLGGVGGGNALREIQVGKLTGIVTRRALQCTRKLAVEKNPGVSGPPEEVSRLNRDLPNARLRDFDLSSAPLLERLHRVRRLRRRRAGIRCTKTGQDFVRGVLKTCVRLVQLARGLACQLAQLISVGHMRKCPEN